MKHTISVVITDLDNTLFDWVDFWYQSFSAMLAQLVVDSGVPEETLLREFKAVHERHGTSEYAFSIEELPSLRDKYPGEDLAKKFEASIQAYRTARETSLHLYPTVAEALETLKDKGCLLVAYTESLSFYSRYRVKKLGLDRVFDYLYSPPDHDLPGGVTPKQIRRYPARHYELRRTIHRHTPKGELKPNPKILADILKDTGAIPSEAVYIGDSLMKDVVMAKAAGLSAVWAEYGLAHGRDEYELLKRVTHWTAADVEREKRLTPESVNPEHVSKKSFDEILGLFEFSPFLEKSEQRASLAIDIWKKTVDVQQHFNDIELRIRNYALTILAAVLAFAAYTLKENDQVHMFGREWPVAALVLGCSVALWLGFYFMDRFWYHRLLYGAVDQGRFIEKRWGRYLPELALTDAIGRHSPLRLFRVEVHTPRKIDIFYGIGLAFLLALALLVLCGIPSTGTAGNSNPPSVRKTAQPVSQQLKVASPEPVGVRRPSDRGTSKSGRAKSDGPVSQKHN